MVLEADPERGVFEWCLAFDGGGGPGGACDPRPVLLGLVDEVCVGGCVDSDEFFVLFAFLFGFAGGGDEDGAQ